MLDIINKLQRLYKRNGKGENLLIVNSEEPIVLSKTRLTFLELEINLLTQFLYRELKATLPLNILSGLKWTDISTEDLDKIETSINKKFKLKVSPMVEPLISILRGLLETHKKFYSGKAMPFYVKLKKESTHVVEQSKEEFLHSLKNEEKTKRHSEYRNSEKNVQHFRNDTPRNSANLNRNNLKLPINARNLGYYNSFTPRNSHTTSMHRLKYDKFLNFDMNTTPRGTGTRNICFRSDQSTPRKNNKTSDNLRNSSNQNRNILAAKALLGLSVNLPTTEQEIRKAYLRAAMRWHPDKSSIGPNDKSNSCFIAIQNAMELLLSNISKGEI